MLSTMLKNIADDTTGATSIEYGLIISFIVLAMFVALDSVAEATIKMWDDVETRTSEAINN